METIVWLEDQQESSHLMIGNNVRVNGHTGVGSNIKDGETIQGPYFNQKEF